MVNPLVSIIIPTYNRADLIFETLDSITAQSYQNWECIIIDDGSTDNTREILQKYLLNDLRFQYHQRPKDRIKGANSCRNYGFEVSTGTLIKWFDSDDLMHSHFIRNQVNTLIEDAKLDFCACFSTYFDRDTEWFEMPEKTEDHNSISNFIFGKLFFLTPATLWRRSSLYKKDLFDESLYNAHETDFNFRRLIERMHFKYSTEVLFSVRRGHDSIDKSANTNINSLKSKFDYFQKVYNYTLKNTINLTDGEMTYVLQRQLGVFYIIRNLNSNFNSNYKLWRTLNSNIWNSPFRNYYFIKYILASVVILFFKSGYRFVSTK